MLEQNRKFQFLFVVCLSAFLGTHLSHSTSAKYIGHAMPFGHAADFTAYYNSAVNLTSGNSPYDLSFVPVTPPFASLMFVPFTLLPLSAAADLYQWLVPLFAIALTVVFGRALGQTSWGIFLWCLFWVTSQPFHFLFDRGNTELLSLPLVAFAFFLRQKNKDWQASLLLGLAIGIKPNTAVVLPVFLIAAGWRVSAVRLASVLLAIVMTALLTAGHLAEWVSVMKGRFEFPTYPWENTSVSRLFLGIPYGQVIALLFVLSTFGTVCIGLWAMRKEATSPYLAFYSVLPFTATFVRQQYLYSLYLFPLLIAHYLSGDREEERTRRWGRTIGYLGLFFAYLPVAYLDNRFGSVVGKYRAYWITSLGTFCFCLGNALLLGPAAKRTVAHFMVRR